jgi:hypothetical protein
MSATIDAVAAREGGDRPAYRTLCGAAGSVEPGVASRGKRLRIGEPNPGAILVPRRLNVLVGDMRQLAMVRFCAR